MSDFIINRVQMFLAEANKASVEISDELIEEFGNACKDAFRKQFTEKRQKEFKYRMSNIGKPLCQLQMEKSGAGELLVTSMDRDGTQVGFDIDLTSKISSKVNIPVIASGGVGNLDHLADGIKLGNASAVLAASIFHYGKYSVKEAKEYLDSKGIPVRI